MIYPEQSGTGRSQNTFFTETGKEPANREKDGKLRIAIMLKCNLRQHMDFYDEYGNLTDTAFEAMAEEMDSEDYAGLIEHLAEAAAAETVEETADYSETD